jgi:hypothetical protein
MRCSRWPSSSSNSSNGSSSKHSNSKHSNSHKAVEMMEALSSHNSIVINTSVNACKANSMQLSKQTTGRADQLHGMVCTMTLLSRMFLHKDLRSAEVVVTVAETLLVVQDK